MNGVTKLGKFCFGHTLENICYQNALNFLRVTLFFNPEISPCCFELVQGTDIPVQESRPCVKVHVHERWM